MTKKTLAIHSQNILPIIKKWLYTEKDIFIRELISNASDAIQKLKILHQQSLVELDPSSFKIDILIDKPNKTLTFRDNGIGMTKKEVEKYIANIAFSGAEEFLQKYQSDTYKDQIIGHFGLGFFSSFMVSEAVEIQTLSYQKGSKPAHWQCDGSADYELEDGTASERGTSVILHIQEADAEFLEEGHIKEILKRYCSFLPVPIYLNEEKINTQNPIWTLSPSECTEKDYLDFFHYLWPMEEEPLFWIHIDVDYPFNLKGVLYFPKIHKQFDFNKSHIHLYCNRVFVSDTCKDIIPDYLNFLRGVIDSPDIPLNVSRSNLQMDKTVRQLSSHISKKVADRLHSLYRNDRKKYETIWKDIEIIIKLGIMQDDKFYERMKSQLIFESSLGQWTTIEEYLERNQLKHANKVFYIPKENDTSHLFQLYQSQGIELLFVNSLIDSSLINFLESKLPEVKFTRADGTIDDAIMDKSREKTILNTEGKSEAAAIGEAFKEALNDANLEVEAKSLQQDNLPAFVVIDEKSRRMKEFMTLSGQKELFKNMPEKKTFVVNTNNALILSIHRLMGKKPTIGKKLCQQIYHLSLLDQKEISPELLHQFVEGSRELLTEMAEQIDGS